MDENEDLKAKYENMRQNVRRAIAVVAGLVIAAGGFLILTRLFGSTGIDDVGYWPIVVAAATVAGWWAAQTDNRRAVRENDKTLIVSNWWRDLTVVVSFLGAAAALMSAIGFLAWGITLGAGISSLAGWLSGRHIWKRAPLTS